MPGSVAGIPLPRTSAFAGTVNLLVLISSLLMISSAQQVIVFIALIHTRCDCRFKSSVTPSFSAIWRTMSR